MTLVFEIGTEAIPADYMAPALRALEEKAAAGLAELRLPGATARALGTPNRLVLILETLPARQEDVTREITGPRLEQAFRDGKPTPAAEGFAKKNGVAVEALETIDTDRGTVLVARVHEAGRPTPDVLPALLERLAGSLPWPKTMRWSGDFLFPRPIRWILCLLEDRVLPVTVAGLASGRRTRGHRLLGPGMHEVADAAGYLVTVQSIGVVLDPEARRAAIRAQLEEVAGRLGTRAVDDPELLDEVVFLAEHPRVLSGSFDPEYLELPREVVTTAMRSHQRYFAVEDAAGRLRPSFLVVCDGEWDDPSQVLAGNERVLRARLADARFYWDVDRNTGLDALADRLRTVVWLEAVGTMFEKSERVAALVDMLGRRWYPGQWPDLRDVALRAARLAKADLASEMIKDGKEFTGLQGVIGARYAEALGEDPSVAEAMAEQYLPRSPEDPLPASRAGLLLAIADRLDTLVGCLAAGFVPSGSQDPYALRRAGNGIVRMLVERELHASLEEFTAAAVDPLPAGLRREGLSGEILAFLRDRTAFFLRDRGISYDVTDAVLAADSDDPLDAAARAKALQAVRGESDLERLVVGYKRAANILKGVEEPLPAVDAVDWSGAEPEEKALSDAVLAAREPLAALGAAREYGRMLQLLLELRPAIDLFFDKILVMSKDDGERRRRLGLLAAVRGLFAHLCDLSRIVIEGE